MYSHSDSEDESVGGGRRVIEEDASGDEHDSDNSNSPDASEGEDENESNSPDGSENEDENDSNSPDGSENEDENDSNNADDPDEDIAEDSDESEAWREHDFSRTPSPMNDLDSTSARRRKFAWLQGLTREEREGYDWEEHEPRFNSDSTWRRYNDDRSDGEDDDDGDGD